MRELTPGNLSVRLVMILRIEGELTDVYIIVIAGMPALCSNVRLPDGFGAASSERHPTSGGWG
ncbi:hypothetical protein [Kitasatospora phosalacinea]|uniref:hypothetical protein n=1 Tax=Kitasatospora phosalacinea TaxID=2065 RepID=UPI0014289E3E|nr:hypothetical protein [Kitasatospora phosalacinea]